MPRWMQLLACEQSWARQSLGCGRKAAFTLRVKHQDAQPYGIIIGTLTIIFILVQV